MKINKVMCVYVSNRPGLGVTICSGREFHVAPVDGRHRLFPSAPGRGRMAGSKGREHNSVCFLSTYTTLAGLMEAIVGRVPSRSPP